METLIAASISLVIGLFIPRFFTRTDEYEKKVDQVLNGVTRLEVKMEFLEKSYALVHALEEDLKKLGTKLRAK